MAKLVFTPRADEEVFAEKVATICYAQPGRLFGQCNGKTYFTDKRMVFLAVGLIGAEAASFEIAMSDIASVETYLTPPAFPFGIRIKMKNGDLYKIGITVRGKYVKWLQDHIG